MEHTAIPQGEIHSPYQWIVADIAARDAIAPAPTDVDKLCLQRSDRRVFRLLSVAPITWEADHLHAAADIMGLGTAASLDAASGGDAAEDELVLGNDSRLTDHRQPIAHSHAASEIDGLGTASGLNVATTGNAGAGEVVKGNDSRLTDARTPTTHGHTTADITGNYDATRLVGLVPIASMPPAALERLVVVANQAARYALTTASVQAGDTVKEADTGLMWYVKDDTQLGNAAGYEQYTAGQASAVPWGGVTEKPDALQGGGSAGQYVAGDMTLRNLGTAAQLNAPSSGNAASGEVVKGSDSRLTDARTPTAHSHIASPTHLTTNTTLASNAKYSYSAGALTLTLPAAPANGDEVVIYNTGSLLTTVVGRNGKTIMGLAQDVTLDIANKKFVFEYLSASGDWRLGA